ncbi:hypothetical protein GGH91_006271, partial [Coemansia sp. RSA 2671]
FNRSACNIKQEAHAYKSTWPELRSRYPHNNSDFAPLGLSSKDRAGTAALGVAHTSSLLQVNEAYSQAATMAAYGLELIATALNDPQSRRRRTKQAYVVFATLCGTLLDERDQRRRNLGLVELGQGGDAREQLANLHEAPSKASSTIFWQQTEQRE